MLFRNISPFLQTRSRSRSIRRILFIDHSLDHGLSAILRNEEFIDLVYGKIDSLSRVSKKGNVITTNSTIPLFIYFFFRHRSR